MTFEELKNNKPTIQWMKNDEEGEFYTEENIIATNKVLDSYIDDLKKLGANPSEAEIIKTVKQVVISIKMMNTTISLKRWREKTFMSLSIQRQG